MDGFITLQSHGRVVHLAELYNPDGEDVVLWNELDEPAADPLNLAIEAEEKVEDDIVEEDDFDENWSWARAETFEEMFEGAIGFADGEPVIPGERTPWDEDGYEAVEVSNAKLAEPIPFEEHSNGETLLQNRIGLWKEALLNTKAFWARRSAPIHGYNTYRRKDRVRMEPIRKARRNNRWN